MKLRNLFFPSFLFVATSCTNTNSVNILIRNTGVKDLVNAEVVVSLEEVMGHLQTEKSDLLVLLNEKNLPIAYAYNADSTTIIFSVPAIKKGSQKTYSMNRREGRLVDNLFKFRQESILVSVK